LQAALTGKQRKSKRYRKIKRRLARLQAKSAQRLQNMNHKVTGGIVRGTSSTYQHCHQHHRPTGHRDLVDAGNPLGQHIPHIGVAVLIDQTHPKTSPFLCRREGWAWRR
jgi:hypothetical protein